MTAGPLSPGINRRLTNCCAHSARRPRAVKIIRRPILIGNDAHGTWTRTYGLAKTSQLVQIINDAMEGKIATTTAEVSN